MTSNPERSTHSAGTTIGPATRVKLWHNLTGSQRDWTEGDELELVFDYDVSKAMSEASVFTEAFAVFMKDFAPVSTERQVALRRSYQSLGLRRLSTGDVVEVGGQLYVLLFSEPGYAVGGIAAELQLMRASGLKREQGSRDLSTLRRQARGEAAPA